MTQPTPRWPCVSFALAMLGMLLLLASCAPPMEIPELSGPFGPGSGGPPVNPVALVTQPLTSGGLPLGSLDYDSTYFTPIPTGTEVVVLSDATGAVVLTVAPISGRPDTPCRFQAALLARDHGYAILAAGDRTNALGLDFHEVDLGPGADFQRFYCAELKSHLGVLINGISKPTNALGSEQVHLVLNSVRP